MNDSDCWILFQKTIEAKKQGQLHQIINDVRKGLRYAKKQDNNQLYYQFASTIHYYNFVIKQDAKAGKQAAEELELARQLRDAEESARVGYTELSYKLNRSRRNSKAVRNELKEYCDKMSPLIELQNATISTFVFAMLVTQAYLNYDYKSVIFHCQQAVSMFKKKELDKSQHFYSLMMPALIISQKYEKASSLIREAKKRITGKRYSWSVFVFFETINLLHAEHYELAYERLIEADKKEQINPAIKEQWQITKGFFQILSNAGYLENTIRFRILKILNEVPIFNKDKYGNFINILILKVILGIQENRVRLIEEREGIEKAYQRYCLKGSREQIFLRILLRVPMHRFNRSRVEKACEKDIALLRTMPMNAENLDIIPWVRLVEIVINGLK